MAKKPRTSTKTHDLLGQYKPWKRKGVPTSALHVLQVPEPLKRRFKAAVEIHGDTMGHAIMRFMKAYAVEIEKKYDVYLDPELPAQYLEAHAEDDSPE